MPRLHLKRPKSRFLQAQDSMHGYQHLVRQLQQKKILRQEDSKMKEQLQRVFEPEKMVTQILHQSEL